KPISSPHSDLKDHYEIVIIGSGYGGAVAASRLARAGREVCLLERGREILPGDYPRSAPGALEEFQIYAGDMRVGKRTGMFELYASENMNVLKGCGLGGGSLINASVSLRPDQAVYADPRWPKVFREDPDLLLNAFDEAERMLQANPYPDDFPVPHSLHVLGQSAQRLGAPLTRPPINVCFEDGV